MRRLWRIAVILGVPAGLIVLTIVLGFAIEGHETEVRNILGPVVMILLMAPPAGSISRNLCEVGQVVNFGAWIKDSGYLSNYPKETAPVRRAVDRFD
jgi:hypothetical protein